MQSRTGTWCSLRSTILSLIALMLDLVAAQFCQMKSRLDAENASLLAEIRRAEFEGFVASSRLFGGMARGIDDG